MRLEWQIDRAVGGYPLPVRWRERNAESAVRDMRKIPKQVGTVSWAFRLTKLDPGILMPEKGNAPRRARFNVVLLRAC